ncbi:S1 RNA-binding domain-containing protein [Romeria aff. gracilis LEGE 07310]|uniref:S1 RNA-binding domain-containing protein n=1 Tax=Vasconcelosia minhoensis LEGE 07310 TaxID=915328 RepID=A0A8J7DBN1_9CYAN|nr:S1 RNA-binding domain-containing protein [Romeria gracilis]MBE9076643.1 S1 RNA-binding domain-containing protein [Romeria aff. gracilis LEGE 07310]
MTFSAEDFAKALEQHDYQFQRGSTVTGKVDSHEDAGAYIDIGGKSAAFLPRQEAALDPELPLEEAVPLGTERQFLIVRDQDANGQVVLSIRQMEIQALWEQLAERQAKDDVIEVEVTGSNKGGVTADVSGLRAFIPRSHLAQKPEDLNELLGQRLTVAFLEVNPETNKLVLSERIAARSLVLSRLQRGQVVSGTVASIKPFGAFIDFDGASGLLHIKQVSKSYVESLGQVLQVGQPIKAVVTNIDDERGRISLSTQALEKYPGEMLKEPETVMAEAEQRAEQVSKVLAESDL